jgi:anti-sigma factor RsiW
MSALTCSEVLPHLESCHRGDASPELRLLIDGHLAHCPPCRRRLAHLKQISSMLSAWRPVRPPRFLRREVSEAVSDELAAVTRHRWLHRRAQKRLSNLGKLSTYQRLANWLIVAALLFLGGAIAYRVCLGWSEPSKPAAAVPAEKVKPAETSIPASSTDEPVESGQDNH